MPISSETSDSDALHELFSGQLRDILWAERQLAKVLSKKARQARSEQLKSAIEAHHDETQTQISRLESILEKLNMAPRGKACKAMEGLLAEGDELSDEFQDSQILDLALITASRKVEHYEIATYTVLIEVARSLGFSKIADELNSSLAEEIACDQALSELAEEMLSELLDG